MSIIEGSAFIDLAHLSERSASRQLAQSDAPLTGTVSAVVDAERGLVEVQIDGSDDLPVVAVADAGLTYVGARVSLPRDSSGRVVGVKAPSGEAPAGVEVVPVGEGARRILASEADIARLDQARADLEAARAELESSQAVLSENLVAAEQSIQAAQEAADAAADDAAQARDRIVAEAARLDSVEGQVEGLDSRIVAAQTTADGKNTITRSTAVPSGDGKAIGDVWWQYSSSSLSGPIIGQWTWDGNTWQASTIGSEVVAYLTADRLRAAVGNFDTGFMDALIASDAFVERIATNLISVKPPNDFPDPYFQDAKGWTGHSFKSDGVDLIPHPAGGVGNAFRITANGTQRFAYYEPEGHTDDTAVTLVPGATYTLSLFVAFSDPVGDGRLAEIYMRFHTASGVGYVTLTEGINRAIGTPSSMTLLKVTFTMPEDATGPCTFAPVVESPMQSGTVMFSDLRVERAMWSTLIEPGAITTPKLAAGAVTANEITASDALWAKLAAFAKVTTQQLIAGGATITEQLLAARIVLQSDLIAGSTSSAYVILNGQGLRAFRMIGGQLVQVLSLGTGSADYLSVTDGSGNVVASIDDTGKGVFAGVNAGDSLTYRGREMSDVLADGPRGVVGYGAGWPWNGEPRHAVSGEESIFEATLSMEQGRLYSIRVLWGWCPTIAGSACEIRLRHTVSASGVPSSPTASTAIDKVWRDTGRDLNQLVTAQTSEYVFAPSSSGVHRWLVSAAYAHATGVILAYDAQMPTIIIEDVGPLPPMITAPSKAIAPSWASAPTAQQRRSKTFYSSGYKTFVTNGGYPPSTGPGHGSYWSYTYQSMVFFPDMTGELAGATILNAALYVHANHFYATSGNTLVIGMHGAASAPGSFQSKGQWSSTGGWSRGEERWIQIPSSLWQGLKDGGYRGVTLESGSSYGYTYPAFAIAVDYIK